MCNIRIQYVVFELIMLIRKGKNERKNTNKTECCILVFSNLTKVSGTYTVDLAIEQPRDAVCKHFAFVCFVFTGAAPACIHKGVGDGQASRPGQPQEPVRPVSLTTFHVLTNSFLASGCSLQRSILFNCICSDRAFFRLAQSRLRKALQRLLGIPCNAFQEFLERAPIYSFPRVLQKMHLNWNSVRILQIAQLGFLYAFKESTLHMNVFSQSRRNVLCKTKVP